MMAKRIHVCTGFPELHKKDMQSFQKYIMNAFLVHTFIGGVEVSILVCLPCLAINFEKSNFRKVR